MMQKLLKEPLVHFVLIGFAIFLLYGYVAKSSSSREKITIDDNDLSHIISIWKLQWQREPTDEELSSLVDAYVRQEVLYREARKLNLDDNDEIIKRRLAQKMEFLSNDVSSMANDPTDDVLKQFFREHAQKYMTPYAFSFYQIGFSPERHQDSKKAAEQVLKANSNTAVETMRSNGDPLPFPFSFNNVSADRLNAELGGQLADSLQNMAMNRWVGPVKSGFGYHLIYITSRKSPELPDFENVKREVQRDYEYDKEMETQKTIYRELRSKYEIDIQAERLTPKLSEYMLQKING